MRGGFCLLFMVPGLCLVLYGCSPRIYQPPRIGAEHVFEDGYFDKKPRSLFDKKMEKELIEKGVIHPYEPEKKKASLPKTTPPPPHEEKKAEE